MSVISLLQTISFFLLLLPALDLADHQRNVSSLKTTAPTSHEDHRANRTELEKNNKFFQGGTTISNHGHRHATFPPFVLRPPSTVIMTKSRQRRTRAREVWEDKGDKSTMEKSSESNEPKILAASSSSGRSMGPYFESNRTSFTVTARAGEKVLLDCAVIFLQGRTVSWLRRKSDDIQLLTVGNQTYSSDTRIGLHFRYPNNWRLGIINVNKRDEGEYKCQLSTHPPKALIFLLRVIAPAVQILDVNGHAVNERHYKVDSSLHLTCKASHLDKKLESNHLTWFKGDRLLPGGDNRIKVKVLKNQTTGEASAFLSVLSVRKGDSGNYSCRASSLASNTIAVHVLNGELPAAVQHESSANVLGSYLNVMLLAVLAVLIPFAY